MERLDYIARQDGRLTVSGAPAGYDAYVAAESARRRGGPVLFVALDDAAAETLVRIGRMWSKDPNAGEPPMGFGPRRNH